MGVFVPGGGSTAAVSLPSAANISIVSETLGAAGTFTTVDLTNIKTLRIRARTGRIQIKSAPAGDVWTLLPGEGYEVPHINIESTSLLYFASTANNDVLDMEIWTT